MASTLFICNGVFRSGSTWSFNVVRKLAEELATQQGKQAGSAFFDHNGLDAFLRTDVSKVTGPLALKAHFAGPLALQWLRLSKMRAICTYRDPRDCIASDRTFLGWDMDRLVQRVGSNFQAIEAYRGVSSVLMVRYEEMMRDPLQQIRRIATHMGVNVSEDVLRRIDGETNVQSSLKVCQQLKHRSANEVLYVADHRVDPATQLHDNHIFNAKVGRWRTEFTAEEGRELTRLFYPWLIKIRVRH